MEFIIRVFSNGILFLFTDITRYSFIFISCSLSMFLRLLSVVSALFVMWSCQNFILIAAFILMACNHIISLCSIIILLDLSIM